MGSGLERLKEKDRNLSQLRYSTRRVPDFNGTENVKIMAKLGDGEGTILMWQLEYGRDPLYFRHFRSGPL